MEKSVIIPIANDKRKPFYARVGANLPEALTEMGLDPKMGTEAVKQSLAWGPGYDAQQQAALDAKAAAKKQEAQNKAAHDAVQSVLDQIKTNPKYTPEIQALLGTAPTEHDPAAKAGADQPVIKQGWTAGHVDLTCLKHHHAQIQVQCMRGTETDFTTLATLTHPHYVDTRPNLVPGTAETRTYRLIYMDHDTEVGSYSAPVAVAVLA